MLSAGWGELTRTSKMLVDTGASGVAIDASHAERLGLQPTGKQRIHGVHGWGELNKYVASLVLPVVDMTGFKFALRFPVDCTAIPDLSQHYADGSFEVCGVLGRNFLQFCQLQIDGGSGGIELSIDRSILLPRE